MEILGLGLYGTLCSGNRLNTFECRKMSLRQIEDDKQMGCTKNIRLERMSTSYKLLLFVEVVLAKFIKSLKLDVPLKILLNNCNDTPLTADMGLSWQNEWKKQS